MVEERNRGKKGCGNVVDEQFVREEMRGLRLWYILVV